MMFHKLEDLVHTDIEYVPLDQIALLVARDRYPDLEPEIYLTRLDEFASRASFYTHNVQGGKQVIQAFNHFFFETEGFEENREDFYNPNNCFLNDVLDHRSGIPITIAIVYIEIGRRLGLPLSGVNFPGHFLIRYDFKDESLILDPSGQGKILDQETCGEMYAKMFGAETPFRPDLLDPASKREILLRLLTNLKIIYLSKKRFDKVLPVLTKIILFNPRSAESLKERAIVNYELECFQPALKDFNSYIQNRPDAEDRSAIEECIRELRQKVGQIQ